MDKLNHQENAGPAEHINAYINDAGQPERILISVGATRYTDYGEHNFLQKGDISLVVIYPSDIYSPEEILRRAGRDNLEEEDISVLAQEVVL